MKKFTLLVFIALISAFSYAGHFVPAFTGSGIDQMTLSVYSATLQGVDLESGDEIAVFDGSICCGVYILDKTVSISDFVVISASKGETGLSNGYTIGHTISYKFWDKSANKAISGISIEYYDKSGTPLSPTPTFSANEDPIMVKLSCDSPINQIPVSKAGTDQTVGKSSFVTLDGSASSDADTDPLTYHWTVPSGITLSSTTVAKPTFTAPTVATATNYTFSLIVNDGVDNSVADEVVITVKPSQAPTANAGTNQTVNELSLVALNGTASDPDAGDVLTYKWTAPSAIKLSSTTVLNPTFTAPEVWDATVDYTLSLVANDGTVDSPVSQVVITVKNVNKAPIANAGADQSVNEGATVTLDGSKSSDPDFDDITYKWTAPAGITLSLTTVAKPTFTAPEVNADIPYTFSLVVNDKKLDSPVDQIVVTVKNINKVPVANAGPDQSVNEGATVTLDGTASTDPDTDPLTYKWTAPAGVTLSSASDAKPTFTAPEVTADKDYTFTLIVNDGKSDSPSDAIIVKVKQVNKAPVANAGPDQSANELSLVTLDGSASSDPDNDALNYKWTAPAGITLSSATAVKPTFTAPEVTADKDYAFTLIVNDGIVDSPADQVIVKVKQVNKAPVANAGPDQSVNEGATVTLDASGSTDFDSDPLTYKWTAPAGITLSSLTDAKPTFVAPEVMTNTNYTISLIVNDGKADSPKDDVIITVKQVNKAPVANAGPDQAIYEGATVTLDGSSSTDPDNDALTYLWTAPASITLSSTTVAKPTFTAPPVLVPTDLTFTLVVSDGTLNSTADQVNIKVKVGNKKPVANAGADQSPNEGTLVTLDGTASSDPDSDPLTYKWTAPTGITLSSTTASKPTFTAPEVSVDTPYTFTLVVNDGTIDSPADEVIIIVKQVNKIPVANAGSDQTVNENSTVTLDASGSTDGDGDALTYKWTAPAGVTLSSASDAKPTFTAPEVTADKDYTFSLIVNDGKADSPVDQVVVKVKQVNKAPVANAGPAGTFSLENSLVPLDGSASSDPDHDALTYLWTAPAGITLSSTTAVNPTFTAPEVRVNTPYTFSLVVNDGVLNSTAAQVVITVVQVNKAPVANAGSNKQVTEKKVVELDGSLSSDFDNDALTYKWTSPAGITLNSNSAVKPTFTAPDVILNTDYTFSLVVNDGALDSPVDHVTITVVPNKAPIANAGPDKSVFQKQTVTLNGSLSSDPENDALTYVWTAPAGITLINANTASPSFEAPMVAVDTNYSFKLKVNDGELDSPEDEVIIKVLQNQAPLANAGPFQIVNEGSLVTIDGTASSDPDFDNLTYSWTAPDAIVLSSTTGAKTTFIAPNVSYDLNFIIKLIVNDGKVNSDPDYVVITVKHVNKAPVANAGSDQSVNEGATATLDGSASSDPENSALTYLWTAPAGIKLSSATIAKPTFTAPEVAANTNYTFSLVVNDGMVNSIADQVVVTVKQVNKTPVANAGADQSVNEGVTATLDGSASSDPDNDVLTYNWTAPAGITLSSTTVAKPTFTAPEVVANTDFTFSLVVSDGTVNSVADQVVVTVKQVNKAPVANAGSDQSVNEGATAALDGSASSDLDGDALTYLWTAPAGITLSSTTVAKPTFTAPEVAANTDYTFSLVVNDGTVNSVADQVVVTVKQVNKAPVANAGADQLVKELTSVTLDGSASSDPDKDVLTYLWTAPAGITLSSATVAKPTFTAPEVTANTDYTFTLVVNDGTDNSVADQVVVTVANVDHAPYVKDSIKNISVEKKSPNKIIDLKTVFADDDLGDVLTYTVTSNADDKIVKAEITGSNLTLSFSTENVGVSEIVITASSNGKVAKSMFMVETTIPVGINPLIEDTEVQIYPNPTKGSVHLNFSKIPRTGTWVTVYSISGQLVSKTLVSNKEELINLTGNPSGTYLIKVDQKASKTYKLIVE